MSQGLVMTSRLLTLLPGFPYREAFLPFRRGYHLALLVLRVRAAIPLLASESYTDCNGDTHRRSSASSATKTATTSTSTSTPTSTVAKSARYM